MRFLYVSLVIGLLSLNVAPVWGQLTDADIAALREQGQREGWTFTITKSEATQYPLSQLCGVVKPKDWAVGARFDPCTPRQTLPATFDWRNYNGYNYCTPIKNQGGCGSCWAFALIGSVESNILIKDLTTTDLSEQWLVSCTGLGGCNGAWPGYAANFLLADGQHHDPCGGYGAVMESAFPYVAWDAPCGCPYEHPYTLDNWAFIGPEWGIPTVDQLKQAILDHGPITVCVYASGAFQGYGGGIFNACSGTEINHAVDLVGWDDNQGGGVWFMRNSWGPGWGESGYMRIVYNCSLIGYNGLYVDYPGSANMAVTPDTGASIAGPVGGPFDPPATVYTLTNSGTLPVSYGVTHTASWLSVANAAGTLSGGTSLDVTVTLDPSATTLPAGRYADTLAFTNFTNHRGDTTRLISLQVGQATRLLNFTMDSDPGWSTQGEWTFGQPTGQGGSHGGYPDPTSGATGSNVYGVNLNGDYSTQYGGPYYLTLGPLDLSLANSPSMTFQRWLNSDYQPYVRAMVQASANGTTWTDLWSNGTKVIRENAWSVRQYDLPADTNYCPTVYLRWGYQIMQNAIAYSGWNIDDVEIWGFAAQSTLPGDLNCDGHVDFGDINPFVLALTDPAAYQAAYPQCNIMHADINGDGSVGFGDINPFVTLLTAE